MIAATTSENIEKLVYDLGLKPGEDGVYYGKQSGFPVGFKFMEAGGYGTALFHIRCPFNAGEKTGGKLSCGEEVDDLIANDKVEVSLENKIVWVTIVDGIKALADGSAKSILTDVLDALEKADLKGESDRCHYCLRGRVWDPVCIDGRVAQICPACIEQRSQKGPGIEKAASVVPLPLQCVIATLFGISIWVAFWTGFDRMFQWFHLTTLHIPNVLFAFVTFGLGALVGGPIGLVLKGLRKQQQKLAQVLMYGLAALAVIMGEILYSAEVLYHEFDLISPSAAVRILPTMWAQSDSHYLIAKIIAAGSSLAMTDMAAKKLGKRKIKL
jgi:hypothetical protein